MPKYQYKPLKDYDECCKPTSSGEEKVRYPTVYLDVDPSQLKGLEVDEDVEIVIRGKVESLRYDTDDSYGTGASVRVSLRSSDITNKETESVIDDLIGDD